MLNFRKDRIRFGSWLLVAAGLLTTFSAAPQAYAQRGQERAVQELARQLEELKRLLAELRTETGTEAFSPVVSKIIDIGRNDNKVMDHLNFLVNRIGPRLTGSHALNQACEWTAEQFKSFGLQNVHLVPGGEVPVGFERGPWSGRMLEPEEMTLQFATNAWTAGTMGVQSGPVVAAPKDEEELSEMRDKLKGAWVLVGSRARGGRGGGRGQQAARGGQRGQRGQQAGRGGQRGQRGQQAGRGGQRGQRGQQRGQRGQQRGQQAAQPPQPISLQASAMQDVGALGFITATGGRRPELITTGGRWPASMADIPTTPAIKLLKEQYDAIKERLADGQDVVLEFDIRNHFKPGPVTYYNVIADIPGTEFPDEYVIIGGHIDSWDGATGTVDNGTGVSTTLEAARILMAAGAKPRRTIRFMVWGGEEQGLLGSRHYVENNPDLMPKISCCIVHDGGTNYLGGIAGVKSQLDDFNKIFAPLINLNPDLPFEVTETQALRGGGSDHASFLRAGVPGFFWRQRGRANYTFAHHTQHDTYEEAIPEYQRHSSIVVAIGALGIANLDHLLSREGISGDGGGEK